MLWKSKDVQRYRRFQKNIQTGEYEEFQFESGAANYDRYLVLDGQQRLTSLLVATRGTYDGKRFYLDILSGKIEGEDKDPGSVYYEGQFLTDKEANLANSKADLPREQYFLPFGDLTNVNPASTAILAARKGRELGLSEEQIMRLTDLYLRAASIMGKTGALQVIFVGETPGDEPSIDEVLEIFVRVNSGGLVLQKADLLMSLLDLHWNDIQPELMAAIRELNTGKPYEFTRDDLLKSLLLVLGSETRFDRLVADRRRVAALADRMVPILPKVRDAWRLLAVILNDNCKIYSERFFRGGHNALLLT